MIYPKLSDGTIDWCVMCKNEGDDFYDLCCECEYPENSDDPPVKYEPKPITNADRIRAMNDEELAEWVIGIMCKTVKPYMEIREKVLRDNEFLRWLKQEAHDA